MVAFNPLKERKETQQLSAFKRQDAGLNVCKALERDWRNVLTVLQKASDRHIASLKVRFELLELPLFIKLSLQREDYRKKH